MSCGLKVCKGACGRPLPPGAFAAGRATCNECRAEAERRRRADPINRDRNAEKRRKRYAANRSHEVAYSHETRTIGRANRATVATLSEVPAWSRRCSGCWQAVDELNTTDGMCVECATAPSGEWVEGEWVEVVRDRTPELLPTGTPPPRPRVRATPPDILRVRRCGWCDRDRDAASFRVQPDGSRDLCWECLHRAGIVVGMWAVDGYMSDGVLDWTPDDRHADAMPVSR